MSTLAISLVLSAAPLAAQSNSGGASNAAGAVEPTTPLPASVEEPAAPIERVLDIRIVGNKTISRDKVLANMGTRIDRPFDQATFEKDIRKLSSKNWFVHVHPLPREHVAGGVIVTLEVVERPVQEYVKFLGNKKAKSRLLQKEAGVKKGDPLDIYAVQDGQRKIESYYQSKGFNDVKVTILEGSKIGDHGTIYLINEGKVQKFSAVLFEGNSNAIAPSGQLKTKVQSRVPILWVFKGKVDRKKIDEDVEKLTAYYRGLGFFKATVGRDYEYNDEEDRVMLKFYISEGPRYRVRNVSFIGNKVYAENALGYNLKLKGGDYFDQSKMNTDIGTVKDLYGSHGFVFADSVADLRFFEEPGELDLIYKVSEGSQYRIGDITIQIKGDNSHTRYSTVLHRLSMRPGDIADIRQFRTSERRLKGSGLYNTDPSKGELPKIVFSPPDSEENSTAGKKRATARANNPDSFRGQSPDELPTLNVKVAVAAPILDDSVQGAAAAAAANPPVTSYRVPAPARPSISQPGVKVRFQSPDSGFGGRAVNPITPGPQPYSVNQPPAAPPPVTTQPYAGQPAYGAPQPAYGAPQPAYGAPQPAYGTPAPAYGVPGQPGYGGQGGPGLGGDPPQVDTFGQNADGLPLLPVIVTMNEAQTGKFMFGAGVNSNAGLVGSIVLDEQNFDWQRVPTSWEDFRSGQAFRGAGQKFRIELAPGTQVSRYMANFTEPYLFDTSVGLGLSAYYFQRFYQDWTEQRAGGRASLLYQFSPDLSGSLTVRGEEIRISNPRILGVPALDEVLGYTQLYSGKAQLAHDTRNNSFLPTEGHYIEADFEYGFGSFTWPRFMSNLRQHWLLKQRPDGTGQHSFSIYEQFGITGSNTPIYERFFAGGFGTLRGFQFRGASPMINTVEVGGMFETLTSLEYMFPITADDMLRGVAFVDFGTVELTDTINWTNYRIAPGFGFRITIPMISMAPIALDFAVPVHNAPTDLKQVFSFFVGVGH
jgi:outer membrane protein insertion porin family